MAKSSNLTRLLLLVGLCGIVWSNLLAQGNWGTASSISVMHTPEPGPLTLPKGDSTTVTEAIARVYAEFSAGDPEKYRTLLTEDYLLLENGELLDTEGDVALMTTQDSSYQRKDMFDFRSVKIHGDIAYCVYFLKSEIKDRNGIRNREWLESAILRYSGSGWRLALLHSTRITKSGS